LVLNRVILLQHITLVTFSFIVMKKKIHSLKQLKETRKNLRNNSKSAEATFWTYLKRKQLLGRKFRRQQSIENYVVDFYCSEEKPVIELNGACHFSMGGQAYDELRYKQIRALGVKVLRFENILIFENIESVLEEIVQQFEKAC